MKYNFLNSGMDIALAIVGGKMTISDWQKRKLQLLAEYFDYVGYLYTIYLENFLQFKDFWMELILMNVMYSDWIESMGKKIEDDEYYYEIRRFNIESINNSLGYLKKVIKKHKYSNVSLREALSTALGFETGMISLKFYEIIKPNNSKGKELVTKIKENKQESIKKIKEIIKNLQSGKTVYVN